MGDNSSTFSLIHSNTRLNHKAVIIDHKKLSINLNPMKISLNFAAKKYTTMSLSVDLTIKVIVL